VWGCHDTIEAMKTAEKQRKVPGRPFPPGVSGNPHGRPPKGWTWKDLLIEASEEAGESGEPVKKLLARKLVQKGLEGDVSAIKEFGDRIDGKPTQPTDITTGGEPLTGITVKVIGSDD